MFQQVGLAALSAAMIATAPSSSAATVLTLEGGFVGMQHVLHFTPTQLRGNLCRTPNHCRPVHYFALPGDEQIVLFGTARAGR
ncbi:hypothetical protein ACXDF8_10150 [Mycolicibacterium sp. CBM1]